MIWTFDPLESSSYDAILDTLSEYVEKFELMDPNQPYNRMVQASGLPYVARTMKNIAEGLDSALKSVSKYTTDFFDDLKAKG